MSYFKSCVLDYKVILSALKRIIANIYIVFLCIAVPSFFVVPDITISFKLLVFFIIFIAIIVLSLIYCLIKQWWYIVTEQETTDFHNLSSQEKGNIIGDILKGAY